MGLTGVEFLWLLRGFGMGFWTSLLLKDGFVETDASEREELTSEAAQYKVTFSYSLNELLPVAVSGFKEKVGLPRAASAS